MTAIWRSPSRGERHGMAKVRRTAPDPSVAQVREYVLTMLEGLSSLAESVEDRHTGDRLRDLADHLVMSWAADAEVPPRPDADRLAALISAQAVEHPDKVAAADHPRGGPAPSRRPGS